MTAPIMLKFKSFSIQNFKSINQIHIDFDDLTCIVGMNGAGKSTILQALDFTSQLMAGRMDVWLDQRGWDAKQLINQNLKPKSSFIKVAVNFEWIPDDIDLLHTIQIKWVAVFDIRQLKCVQESIFSGGGREIFHSSEGELGDICSGGTFIDILWDYTGSVLSSMADSWFEDRWLLAKIREILLGISSLELLSPVVLKKSSRATVNRIGMSGENLPSFIHSLNKEQQEELTQSLRVFYPHLSKITTKKKVGGWVQLEFEETFKGQKTVSESIHINDGLLRILAVLAQQKNSFPTLLLLDEIENGVNQEIMGKLVKFLSAGQTQVVITTHSPLLLNYLTDEQARRDVYFAYRTETGSLNIRKFFDVIDEPKMLDFAGPGEVYANTNLNSLADKCRALDNNQPKE
ncbi:AAA family ATPase [Neisseria arctica]|uniref:AAA family ATPase n=1 Tax=Neisseria arctica TaxID=1470200 RepID=UPI00069A0D32|nr:ATP-binding protein [Neisseria arctica]UOO85696.1 AAA family ATPase [Neisseria arctica]